LKSEPGGSCGARGPPGWSAQDVTLSPLWAGIICAGRSWQRGVVRIHLAGCRCRTLASTSAANAAAVSWSACLRGRREERPIGHRGGAVRAEARTRRGRMRVNECNSPAGAPGARRASLSPGWRAVSPSDLFRSASLGFDPLERALELLKRVGVPRQQAELDRRPPRDGIAAEGDARNLVDTAQ
jgi:hypothetical protein